MGKILVIKNADFSANAIDLTMYSIILNVNNSTLGSVSGSGTYEEGTTAIISATPISTSRFVKWSDGNKNAVRQITITSNITLTAEFVSVPTGYEIIIFDGTENWQFNSNGEPNSHGIYNCYLINPDITNPKLGPATSSISSFYSAECNVSSLNRLINTSEMRGNTVTPGFGYNSSDPSVFFRFDSSIATSVETFKAYLANNIITIIYQQN